MTKTNIPSPQGSPTRFFQGQWHSFSIYEYCIVCKFWLSIRKLEWMDIKREGGMEGWRNCLLDFMVEKGLPDECVLVLFFLAALLENLILPFRLS